MNVENIKKIITDLLLEIGENPNREGLKQTPSRIAKMCVELFRGYDVQNYPKIATFQNNNENTIIYDSGNYYSLCEHHMLPFFGKYVFAYKPNPKGKIIGLSKIARIINFLAAKLELQENLASEIIQNIEIALKDEQYPPLGMAIYLKGRHLCKEMRGVHQRGEMVTIKVTGCFEEPQQKNEFLQTIKNIDNEL